MGLAPITAGVGQLDVSGLAKGLRCGATWAGPGAYHLLTLGLRWLPRQPLPAAWGPLLVLAREGRVLGRLIS
jgi:hypothetical protein